MAITITETTGSEADYYDKYCVAFPLELSFDINFGADVTGETLNYNIYLWGNVLDIQVPEPSPGPFYTPYGGYHHKYNGTPGSFIVLPIGSGSYNPFWDNVEVAIRYLTDSTGRLRVRFLHTFDIDDWIKQTYYPVLNYKRLFYGRPSDPVEYEKKLTFYDQWNVTKYVGVRVKRFTPSATFGGHFDFVEEGQNEFIRYWGWWWNPYNTVVSGYPYSFVQRYEFQFYRNNIPVSTLSTTEDTQCTFLIVSHDPDDAYYGSPAFFDFNSDYLIGLVKVEPNAPQVQKYWLDMPMAIGEASAVDTFIAAESWFPHELNSVQIVGDCTQFTNTSGFIWEATFDIKKECIDPGSEYRVIVIIKSQFTGPPL